MLCRNARLRERRRSYADNRRLFSNLKRGISGNYHSVSSKSLQSYLNEYAWRYNERDSSRAMFRTLVSRAAENV
jgi:hypothetical protein